MPMGICKTKSAIKANEAKKKLNGKEMMNSDEVIKELQGKKHAKICPPSFLSNIFSSMTSSKCVVGFEGMDPNML